MAINKFDLVLHIRMHNAMQIHSLQFRGFSGTKIELQQSLNCYFDYYVVLVPGE